MQITIKISNVVATVTMTTVDNFCTHAATIFVQGRVDPRQSKCNICIGIRLGSPCLGTGLDIRSLKLVYVPDVSGEL